MSRAFVKDDSWEEPVVAPRAPLPDGVPNYVTPRGLALLREEQALLDARRQTLEAASGDEAARRGRLAALAARGRELAGRIASAQVVVPGAADREAVRFGATVTLRAHTGEERRWSIVGVDEADPDAGFVAFTSPIARAILGKRTGEVVELRAAGGREVLEICAIDYAAGA